MGKENLIGKEVMHDVYGNGIVKDIYLKNSYTYIKVFFFKTVKDKNEFDFSYPSVFEKNLRVVDSKLQAQVSEDIKAFHVLVTENDNEELIEEVVREIENSTVSITQFSNVNNENDFIDKLVIAIQKEVVAVKENGGKKQKAFNGCLVEVREDMYYYRFETDAEINLPLDAEVTIYYLGKVLYATVSDSDDYTFEIAINNNLGETIKEIEFSIESWRLLESLKERIVEFRERRVFFNLDNLVFCYQDYKKYLMPNLNKGVETAIAMSRSMPLVLIWGPPGTGKTTTLANIALNHIRDGLRVLMLSYSNVSVDCAAIKVSEEGGEHRPGTLVRYGYPRDERVKNHEYLSSYKLALRNHPQLKEEQENLLKERQELLQKSKDRQRLRSIQNRLKEIRKSLLEEEKRAVEGASFVATTVSKAVIDKVIYEQRFDTVIFDEISMAYIPQIIFAAGLATKHLLCFGDFMQLPPIVQSKNNDWMQKDFFAYCRIDDIVRKNIGHRWLCLLDTQYRMHPDIADFVSNKLYFRLLKSEANMLKKREDIANIFPLSGDAIVLANISGIEGLCHKYDYSRFNPLSALFSIGIALNIARFYEVGIITPYRVQAAILRALVKDIESAGIEIKTITCATVHQFQGSEKDVIIYDSVDCYPERVGKMLINKKDNLSNRLFNVAMTRAKGKFVLISNYNYFKNNGMDTGIIFSELLNDLVDRNIQIKDRAFVTVLREAENNVFSCFSPRKGVEQYFQDIANAKSKIDIALPGKISFEASDLVIYRDFVKALSEAQKRGVSVSILVQDKEYLRKSIEVYAKQTSNALDLITIIDKEIVWFGEPKASNKLFRNYEGASGMGVIIRWRGCRFAKSLFYYLKMDIIDDQTLPEDFDDINNFSQYVKFKCRCKKCGNALKLCRSKVSGGYFLGCIAYPGCDYKQTIDSDLVNEYLRDKGKHCMQCGARLEAADGSRGNIYVQCVRNREHRYKLNEI